MGYINRSTDSERSGVSKIGSKDLISFVFNIIAGIISGVCVPLVQSHLRIAVVVLLIAAIVCVVIWIVHCFLAKPQVLSRAGIILFALSIVLAGIVLVQHYRQSQAAPKDRVSPQLVAGEEFSAVLLPNGTVQAYGETSFRQFEYRNWTDVKRIAANDSMLVGLTFEGKILSSNSTCQTKTQGWKDIEDIILSDSDLIGVTNSRHLVSTNNSLEAMYASKEIVAICGNFSGTVVIVDGDGIISRWKDEKIDRIGSVTNPEGIKQIEYGSDHLVLLHNSGKVSAINCGESDNSDACNVSAWEDMVDIAAGDGFTVGLKRDGTLIKAGSNDYGQLFVDTWYGITDIEAGKNFTLGVFKNSSIMAIGSNEFKQCEINDLSLHYHSISELETGAINGDMDAQTELAWMYFHGGFDNTIDYDQAFWRFSEADSKGVLAAKALLGYMYWGGLGVAENKEKSYELTYEAAQAGDANAQTFLGYMYQIGTEKTPQNLNTAAAWYQKAMDQKHAPAYLQLGSLYAYYKDFGIDYNKAYDCYIYAAERGYSDAQANIGRLYTEDYVEAPNKKDAFTWVRLAAERENAFGLRELAIMYIRGSYCEKDFSIAYGYLDQARNLGDTEAIYLLGELFYRGDHTIPQNMETAYSWYDEASRHDNAKAFYMMGKMNCEGQIENADYLTGINYYETAGNMGVIAACNELGNIYNSGNAPYIEKDSTIALQWYEKAATLGSAAAYNMIGYMYYYGLEEGVDKNVEEAFKNYAEAARLGHADACYMAGTMCMEGLGTTQDNTRALNYFLDCVNYAKDQPASTRVAEAYFSAGLIVFDGTDSNPNPELAKIYFQASAELGNEYAKQFLEEHYDNVS